MILELLKRNRRDSGIATDFDGTISAIETQPAAAKIDAQAKVYLNRLRKRYKLVAVISGRKVKQLSQLVGIKGIHYIGNHGAEYLNDGRYSVDQKALEVAAKLEDVCQKIKPFARQGYEVDFKKYSLAIHYRLHPDPQAAQTKLKQLLQPYNQQLKVYAGRMVFDLGPYGVDKGQAIEYLVKKYRLKYFFYVGDDRTDIDAFNKMQEMKKQGIKTLKVALQTTESPPELISDADLVVAGISEVNKLFKQLL